MKGWKGGWIFPRWEEEMNFQSNIVAFRLDDTDYCRSQRGVTLRDFLLILFPLLSPPPFPLLLFFLLGLPRSRLVDCGLIKLRGTTPCRGSSFFSLLLSFKGKGTLCLFLIMSSGGAMSSSASRNYEISVLT